MEFYIFDDLFGMKLWGENIFRRVYHHISNNNFSEHKVPLIHRCDSILTDEDLNKLRSMNFNQCKGGALNTHFLAKVFDGNYSKKETLYCNIQRKKHYIAITLQKKSRFNLLKLETN